MRVVFMGTPEFAVPSLKALFEMENVEVVGVFTQPDRPVGRGRKVEITPVKREAEEHNVPVFQFERVRKQEGLDAMRALKPDIVVTAAFGQILSKKLLEVPRLGTVNVHASLLPRHRGAAPINWAIISGDKVTGGGIYEQPFAPVTTTVDNKKYYIDGSYLSSVVESDFTTFYYDEKFGVLCQDGGTIMHVSYYDVLARAKILGVDNAYTRMTAIKNWFVAVQAKNPNAASTGWADFFKNYYTTSGALQGGEEQGKYGLQDEFKEAVMLIATAPKIFLGLEAHYDTLTIAPNLGSNLTYFGMENLSFGGNAYGCRATKNSITLSGIHRNVNSGLNVTLKLAYTAGQSVYLNGKVLNASAYTIENGYVIVTTDFANLTLQVK